MNRDEADSIGATESRPDPISEEVAPDLDAFDVRVAPPSFEVSPSERRLYTWEELPPKVRLRSENAGKWVAWSADEESIVAVAERLGELDDIIQQAEIQGAVYEWLDPMPVRTICG